MSLRNEIELGNTRTKLRELEDRYDELRRDVVEDPHVRDVTMRSIKRLINQLKEEVTLFEVHQPARPYGSVKAVVNDFLDGLSGEEVD